MNRIGTEIVQAKKADMALADSLGEKEHLLEKDLLSGLLRSNTMQENDLGKMDDEEVLAQIATFIIAGELPKRSP